MVKLDYAKAGSQQKQKHHRHDQDSPGPVLPCLQNKPCYSCTRLLEKKKPTKMGKAHSALWKGKVTTVNSNISKYPCTDIPFAPPSSNLAIKRMTLKFYLVLFRLPWPEWGGEMSPTNLVICRKHTVLSNTTHLICRHLYPTLESQPWSWGHPEYHDSHSLVPSLLRLWRQWELLLHMSF